MSAGRLNVRYDAWLNERDGIIRVIDKCDEREPYAMSVTNAAEQVVEEVVRQFGYYPILYRDTTDRWDWLLHEKGKFVGFAPGPGHLNPKKKV